MLRAKVFVGITLLFYISTLENGVRGDKLGDFVDSHLNNFGEWLKANNNSGNPASPFPLLFDNIPVFNVSSGAVLGSVSALFNYSVVHSGPRNHTVSPLTNLEDRLLGIRVQYNWTYFYGRYEAEGVIICQSSQPTAVTGTGNFDLGKEQNFFGVAGMGWTNFTVNSNGYVNLNDSTRVQKYFLVDENSGMDKLEMEGLSAGGCEAFVRSSILISLRDQLGVSPDTIHPVPLYRQLDTFLQEKFAETPVTEM